MFIEALAPHVGPRIRAKGSSYVRSGAVISVEGTEWVAHATVRGSRDYRVELVRDIETNRFTGSCECPFYADRGEICKHIWAALLEADRMGLLGGDGPIEGEAIIEPEYDPEQNPMPPPVPIRGIRPKSAPAWQAFLHELQQDVAAAERAVPQPRFANGEIIYAIDARETLAGHGTAVHVLFRQRKRNGEWARPKAASISTREVEHLADPADREVLSLLRGASNPSIYPVDSPSEYGRPWRFYLSGVLESRLLPLLAQTGRAHLATAGADKELLPLEWDAGPAWRFELRINVDDGADAVRIDGAFVRDGQQLALAEPALLLSGGFLFTRTSMARLETRGAFAWIARLRASGPIAIPRTETAPLLETLARSGMNPESLPEDLRYDMIEGRPRPRVRVKRPERRNPYAARQDLQAVVQFDYDGSIVDSGPAANTYDAARRRLVRRDRAVEQAAIDRLHQLGFRYTWSHFESRQLLGIAPDQFTRIVTTLIKEGWHVEADGRPF